MKKALSVLLALILCLPLCACGNQDKYKKYDALIGYIEAGDSGNAINEVLVLIGQNGAEGTETPEVATTTVEITLDNWQEYFEIRPLDVKIYNVFGDLQDSSVGAAFYLKEEYLSRLTDREPEGAFKTIVYTEWHEYDEKAGAFVENGYVSKEVPPEEEIVTYIADWRDSLDEDGVVSTLSGQVFAEINQGTWMTGEGKLGIFKGVITNIEVLDVTGTLELYE